MKVKILILFICVCFSMLTSCGFIELETSGNGKLDGNWHLETIDTLSTGGILDLKKEKVYWAFESKLLVMAGTTSSGFVCPFTFEGNALILGELHDNKREDGDPIVEDIANVAPYGVNAFEEQFRVVQLTSSKLTLQSEVLRLNFRKM